MVLLPKALRDRAPENFDEMIYTIALVVAAVALVGFIICVGNQSIGINIPPSAPPFLP